MSKLKYPILLVVIMVLGGSFAQAAQPLVIAHRGASSLAPENTLDAIKKAIELEVDFVEIDVHRSLDRELVVIHDPTIDRTTNGKGLVNSFTLEKLRSFDAGSWFNKAFSHSYIPTLREVLELTKDKTPLLIELKGERTETPTVKLVQEFGMEDQVIIQSFDFLQIQKVKQRAPEIPTVFLVREPNHKEDPVKAAEWMCNIAEYVDADGIGVRHNWFTPELLQMANSQNLELFVWTVDNKKDMKRFITAGVQGIITNRPQDLISLDGAL